MACVAASFLRRFRVREPLLVYDCRIIHAVNNASSSCCAYKEIKQITFKLLLQVYTNMSNHCPMHIAIGDLL